MPAGATRAHALRGSSDGVANAKGVAQKATPHVVRPRSRLPRSPRSAPRGHVWMSDASH